MSSCGTAPGGCWPRREVLTSAGAVHVTVPRVTDKHTDPDTGERQRLASAILPPWVRKTPRVTEVLPLLYLHGLSSGDFVPALGRFLGTTKGLSAGVVTKLTEQWAAGHPTLVAGCVNLVETERGVVQPRVQLQPRARRRRTAAARRRPRCGERGGRALELGDRPGHRGQRLLRCAIRLDGCTGPAGSRPATHEHG
jgi:hypothetical protein